MYVWHLAWCCSNLNWMQNNSDAVWGRLDVLFILPSASLKRTVNKEAVSIGEWSYEWMRNSRFNRAFNPIKAGLIYLFEIGFNTEFHPSSCAFPQLSGQILERAIEGRKGPLSTLQMGYFLLIPRETSHSHNLARNSISCVKTPPEVFFLNQVDYITGLTLLDPQYSWDRYPVIFFILFSCQRGMLISFN